MVIEADYGNEARGDSSPSRARMAVIVCKAQCAPGASPNCVWKSAAMFGISFERCSLSPIDKRPIQDRTTEPHRGEIAQNRSQAAAALR
jgi:hypothetical protein